MRLHAILPFFVVALGCGTPPTSGFGDAAPVDDGGGGGSDGPCDPNVDPFCFAQDAGADGTVPPCENLECNIVNCGTSNGTTISGKVYDPAGNRGLYNVFVYVPNRALDPIPDMGPTCTACQAPASGKPIASAVTDEKGDFVIKNVPVGTNVPLVMQLGKWRRVIQLPQVKQCVDNPLTDKDQTRLPKKHKEGSQFDHIPKIALTTGCDFAECFMLKRIGLDPAEFTGPSGNGRVHIYQGDDNGQSLPAGAGSLTTLYNNLSTLKQYDIVFSACECTAPDRGQGYANVKSYLESGGRFFGTHYFYNLFANSSQCGVGGYNAQTCKGDPDANSVATWVGDDGYPPAQALTIDTAHPKGKAFGDWLANIGKNTNGTIPLYDLRGNATGTTAKATRYLYTNEYAYYFSWNVPVNAQPMSQCGRGVFSGVHLSGSSFTGGAWPAMCNTHPLANYENNELALEFLFFDLSSCVGDDTKPPPIPPPN